MWYIIVLQSLWLILPAYIANGSAVIVGGGTPIDFGKKYKDGQRILGDGKTWRGLFTGTLIGMIGGFGLSIAAKLITPTEYNHINFENLNFLGFPLMIPIIFSICFGALMGDIIESFFKRRVRIKRGENWIPFDQLDFILGTLFFSFVMAVLIQLAGSTDENWFLETFTIYHILFLLLFTPFIHTITNYAHNKSKKNKVIR